MYKQKTKFMSKQQNYSAIAQDANLLKQNCEYMWPYYQTHADEY